MIYCVHSPTSLDAYYLSAFPALSRLINRLLYHHRGQRGRFWKSRVDNSNSTSTNTSTSTSTNSESFNQMWNTPLFISDAQSGEIVYTLRLQRNNRWSSWTSSFRSFFFNSSQNHNYHNARKHHVANNIAVWKGPSMSGKPYLLLSGSLHNMTFDILTSTSTSSHHHHEHQQQYSVVGVVSKALFGMSTALRDAGRYGVHVKAGYDCALFVLLADVVDELFHHTGSTDEADSDNEEEKEEKEVEEKEVESLVSESRQGDDRGMGNENEQSESLVRGGEEEDSFADEEDRMRDKALKLEKHLTNASDNSRL